MNRYEDMQAEYERLKRERINLLERAGDFFGGVDERLDFLAPKIFETLAKSDEALEEVGKLKHALASLELLEGGAVVAKKVEQIPFSYNLAATQGVRLAEDAPFPGYIKWITIHWPDGCNALVDVRVGHGAIQFCPKEEGVYLALNDATPTFGEFSEWVNDNEEIWVELRNTDAVNPHNITVTVIIEGVP